MSTNLINRPQNPKYPTIDLGMSSSFPKRNGLNKSFTTSPRSVTSGKVTMLNKMPSSVPLKPKNAKNIHTASSYSWAVNMDLESIKDPFRKVDKIPQISPAKAQRTDPFGDSVKDSFKDSAPVFKLNNNKDHQRQFSNLGSKPNNELDYDNTIIFPTTRNKKREEIAKIKYFEKLEKQRQAALPEPFQRHDKIPWVAGVSPSIASVSNSFKNESAVSGDIPKTYVNRPSHVENQNNALANSNMHTTTSPNNNVSSIDKQSEKLFVSNSKHNHNENTNLNSQHQNTKLENSDLSLKSPYQKDHKTEGKDQGHLPQTDNIEIRGFDSLEQQSLKCSSQEDQQISGENKAHPYQTNISQKHIINTRKNSKDHRNANKQRNNKKSNGCHIGCTIM
ncbi:hypothetical protein BB559_003832 [Furculomyces boomerangus]|uniref:Uncharacterized protein n=2 Tax=Harpellales TaxID=61421 RepID=A0A2T9YIJ5_9FUNG|nr:hypothetical protein BB559_003832 [Furculomyces boomerangus]PWA02196.1 hypothetical protein BB558_001669 [Smittium angustum]